MSYCRWSCDNHKSDIYCYEDVSGGWTIHVAGRRRIGDVPDVNWRLLLSGADNDVAEWTRQNKAQQDALDKTDLVKIGLPYDGQSFNEPTLEKFRSRVVMLKEAGYHVPDWVIPVIDEEIAENEE